MQKILKISFTPQRYYGLSYYICAISRLVTQNSQLKTHNYYNNDLLPYF